MPDSVNPGRLTYRYEQAERACNRPIAVEITFAAPDAAPDESPRLPLNVGLSIDRSGSMAGEKLAAARKAALGLLEALNDGERLAAVAFDTNVMDVSESRRLDDGARASIRQRIESLTTGGRTALFDGFARAAELAARGGCPGETDSWVIVLSDGMGNEGLTDPAPMRRHAGALAERGIRTISIGIGDEYQADQLTALAEGGSGEFHHASRPGEIVEIVLGELRALRSIGARDLRVHVDPRGSSPHWLLIGGDARRHNGRVEARFDRVSTGRVARAVVLLWPGAGENGMALDATWLDRAQEHRNVRLDLSPNGASVERDKQLAARAARLWHAHIIARSLELNERGAYEEAEAWLRRSRREFRAYVEGLPEGLEMLHTLDRVEERVGGEWTSLGRRETFVMAQKLMRSKEDLREHAPMGYSGALDMDDDDSQAQLFPRPE